MAGAVAIGKTVRICGRVVNDNYEISDSHMTLKDIDPDVSKCGVVIELYLFLFEIFDGWTCALVSGTTSNDDEGLCSCLVVYCQLVFICILSILVDQDKVIA